MPDHSLILPYIFRSEWAIVAAALITSVVAGDRLSSIRRPVHSLAALASHPRRSVLTIMLLAAAGRLLLLPLVPIPKARIADEFGYLLIADTFHHHRLTNPTSPMWVHFEAFHVFHVPTYQAQYPVGVPAVLALAVELFHDPWWGIFITCVLMCGAVTWAMQAIVPARWAFVAGLCVVCRVCLFSYWMNSFWGGGLAALGGALVVGGIFRIAPFGRRNVRAGAGLWWVVFLVGAGLAMLATTRPFEGALFSAPLVIACIARLIHAGELERLGKTAAGVLMVLVPVLVFVLVYQKAVTGKALLSPYEVASRQYHISKPFIFQNDNPMPHYRHIALRYIYAHFEANQGQRNHLVNGYLESLGDRLYFYWSFFVGPLFSVLMLWMWRPLARRKDRLLWISFAALLGGTLIESWVQTHYLAPAFVVICLLLVQTARYLRTIRLRGWRIGRWICRPLIPVMLVLVVIRVIAFNGEQYEHPSPPNWAYSTGQIAARNELESKLLTRDGRQLVVVHYDPAFHNFHDDWIYNGADLQGAKVLWARGMDAKNNCELTNYYPDRELWSVFEHGFVVEASPTTQAALCDPGNRLYRPAKPLESYFPKAFGGHR